MNYELGGSNIDSAIINALQKDDFQWIGNVPIKALRILREEEKLDYMREILRRGITNLKAKRDKDLLSISKQLEQNFKEAFSKQESELNQIKKEINNILKKEIPITTTGGLAGFLPGIGNIISVISAGRDITKLFKKRENLKDKLEEKESSSINLLLQSYE